MQIYEEIVKIKDLLDSGAITREEFELLKREILAGSSLKQQPETSVQNERSREGASADHCYYCKTPRKGQQLRCDNCGHSYLREPKVSERKAETTSTLKERSDIKAFGVWLGSAAIISFIFNISGWSLSTPGLIGGTLGAVIDGLVGIAVMVIGVVIAVKWKQGKIDTTYMSGYISGNGCWWVYAILVGLIAALITSIA